MKSRRRGHCKTILRKLVLGGIGLSLGIFGNLIFYEFILSEDDFDNSKRTQYFLMSSLIYAFLFTFSQQARCMTFLSVPEMTTRTGRRVLQATILILVISGPMRNIADNGEETVRFLVCIKNMLLDILIAGKDLVLAPINNILYDLKTNEVESAEEKYNLTLLHQLMGPIAEEIEDGNETADLKDENDDTDELMERESHRSDDLERKYKTLNSDGEDKKVEAGYQKKLAYRCEEVFTKGTLECVKTFQGKYDECYDKVTVVLGWALCWPMKLTFICDILSMFAQNKVCDLSDVIESGFGESYAMAKSGIVDFSNSFKVHVTYQGLQQMVGIADFKSSRDELLLQFLEERKYVEWYLTMIKRALSLAFIFILHGTYSYHDKYLGSLAADNIYITKYFRRIDSRRGNEDRSTLLPLKSFEGPNFTKVTKLRLTEKESKHFWDTFFGLCIQGLIVFSMFAFDYLFKELLLLVHNHADMHIRQVGQHVLGIQVKGEGLLAQLLRIIIQDFSVNAQLDLSHYSKPCLPVPRVTPDSYHERVILLFLALFTSAYFEAHIKRLRHCITNFFYPNRARRRTIWLYNETLRKRKARLSHLKRSALRNAKWFRTRVSRNILVWMGDNFPKCCRCVRWLKIGRRKCIICRRNGEVYRCPQCGFSYCKDCYRDLIPSLGCLYCLAKAEIDEREADLVSDADDDNNGGNNKPRYKGVKSKKKARQRQPV